MVTHADSLRRELRASLSLLRPFPGRLEFAARLALICALTTLVVEIYQTPDPALTAYVAFFVTIPASMSVIVNLLLGPPPRRLIERALAHRLALAAAMLRGPDHHKREAFAEALSEGTTEFLTWLKLAGAEKTSPAEDIAALRQAAESIVPILLLVDMIDRSPEGMLPDSFKGHIADVLDEMASILSTVGYPVEISLRDDGAPL